MENEGVAGVKKKARRMKAWLVFQDESGISQRPSIRRTWAPRSRTPVLVHAFNWKKFSVSSAIAYRWDGKRTRLYFQVIPGSYDAAKLIVFLKELRKHFRKKTVILIWDGLPAHKSRAMNEYLLTQRGRLVACRLPGYAPELNPCELLWGNVKGNELANLCADNLGVAAEALRNGMKRVKSDSSLPVAFLEHTGLFF